MRAALDVIRSDPDAGKELQLEFAGYRRVRVGRLRIVYRVGPEIEVLAIGARETIYEDVARMLKPLRERRARYRIRRPGL